MPEGHTLHALARDQNAGFAGKTVWVSSPQGRFADGAALVDGRVLERVDAYGKHLFAAFAGDRIVHVHLGLYGKFAAGMGHPPEPRGALRMRWVADGHWTDLRGATTCEVLIPSEVDVILTRLGPDPLQRRANGKTAFARISRSRAPIAGLLMDQTVLAGIGNVFRAELLYRHLVPPYLAGRHLDPEIWTAMWQDLVTMMKAGVRSGRIITTRPTDRDRRSGYVRHEDAYYVYRRTGLPCRVCGTPIAMQLLHLRKLYWCPTCQAQPLSL